MDPEDFVLLETKELEQQEVSKLSMNEVKSTGSFSLTEEDYGQMEEKFYTFEKLLKREGLI